MKVICRTEPGYEHMHVDCHPAPASEIPPPEVMVTSPLEGVRAMLNPASIGHFIRDNLLRWLPSPWPLGWDPASSCGYWCLLVRVSMRLSLQGDCSCNRFGCCCPRSHTGVNAIVLTPDNGSTSTDNLPRHRMVYRCAG